jgi:tetratricopeptide (TPR) repeat protein
VKCIPNTAATLTAALSALLLSLLLMLQPSGAAAQLVIAGTDEYAQLIFDMQPLDQTGGPPRPPAGIAEPADFPEPVDSVPAPATAGAPGLQDRRSIAAIEATIDTALAESGLYSPLVREQYQALGSLQQQLGQHESAIATLEKSVHIARVNDGLFTPDQEADVQRIIESLMAVGDTERENDYRSYLFYMQQRAYADDDPRLIAAKLAWADWNLHAYQRSSMINPRFIQLPGNDRPEEMVVVRNTQNGEVRFVPRRFVMNNNALTGALNEASRYSLTPEMVVDARLREARKVYEELLETQGDTMDPQQRETLRLKLVAGEYAFKRHIDRLLGEADDRSALSGTIVTVDPMIMRRGFRESSDLLEQEVAALEAANPADPLALATAYLRQADLNIAYQQRREAETWYARTWAALLDAGFDEAAASAWLQPSPLLPVPDFAVHPYSRELFNVGVDDTLPYRGYIDVSLNLTRDGNVRRAEITAASEETPQRVRRLLLAYLRNQKMRPALDKGIPVTQEGLRLRFHYSY